MGFKEFWAGLMMRKMRTEEKKEMMSHMTNRFMSEMSSEEKQTMMSDMMGRFMGNMSKEEKMQMMKQMMSNMMGNMLGNMRGGMPGGMMENMGEGMMGMPMKERGAEAGNGGSVGPWDMCMRMMSRMAEPSVSDNLATPELRSLFEEWVSQIETEVFDQHRQGMTKISNLAVHFKLSEESIGYFLKRLAESGKIAG